MLGDQKIFGDKNIAASATCVRVPRHTEAIQIETSDYIDEKQARSLLEAEGVTISTSAGMEVILPLSMSQLVATTYL